MKKLAVLLMTAAVAVSSVSVSAATISPRSSIDMESESFGDAIYRVGFDLEENVTDAEIFADIYEEVTYDIADIGMLAVGDTIENPMGDVVVESIDVDGSWKLINGGYTEGGITLASYEDSNGWTQVYYDLPAMYVKGQAQLTFADEVTLNIFNMDKEPGPDGTKYETTVCTPAEVKDVLASAQSFSTFGPYRTQVRLEGNLLVEITISYAP